MDFLFIYATRDGQTKRIVQAMQKKLMLDGHAVTSLPLTTGEEEFPPSYKQRRVVVAAPIRYGYHLLPARRFIENNLVLLNNTKTAFISINLTARKPEKSTPETNLYLKKYLDRTAFRPKKQAVFAGALHYPKYGWFDRMMIKLIMMITKGPTDTSQHYEFTNWEAVDAFTQELADWT